MTRVDEGLPGNLAPAVGLLGAAANLTGTCLTAAAVVRLEQAVRGRGLLADNALAFCALCFLLATMLAYGALRHHSARLHHLAEGAYGIGSLPVVCW